MPSRMAPLITVKIRTRWLLCCERFQRRCKPDSRGKSPQLMPGKLSVRCAWVVNASRRLTLTNCAVISLICSSSGGRGGGVEDFSLRVTTLANQLRTLGDKMSEKEEIRKLRDHLEQVAISIETLLDLNKMTIEETTSHLRTVKERKRKHTSGSKEGCLLLTEEEWMARLKVRDGESSGGGGGRGDRGRGRGRHSGHGGIRGSRGSNTVSHEESARPTNPTDVCQTCGKLSHWAKECSSKGKKTGQAHVAEEEEVGLLLVESSELERVPRSENSKEVESAIAVPTMALVPRHSVHLVKQGVFAQIREEGGAVNSAWWVVDMGATNHMSGMRVAFSILDTGVCGTVRFGDGSVVCIEGCDMIIFGCKNGEHLSFSGVYYIPKLKMNILSVGQLDEMSMKFLSNLGGCMSGMTRIA
jgi:hypothetical protein